MPNRQGPQPLRANPSSPNGTRDPGRQPRCVRRWPDGGVPSALSCVSRDVRHGEPRTRARRSAQRGSRHGRCRTFQRALFDAGLAGLTLAAELGGQELDAEHERVWREEAAAFPFMTEPLAVTSATASPSSPPAVWPTSRPSGCGRCSRRRRSCQLFSEPDAGSTSPTVRTRAVPDERGWRITGQKVWTTYADVADVGVLLAAPARPPTTTTGSRCSSSTCGRRASRSGRSTRSTVRSCSTRSTSMTSGSTRRRWSRPRVAAGG